MTAMRLLLLLLLTAQPAPAQQPGATVDYLVVQRPGELQILNKYEQTATPRELQRFQPYRPLQILEKDAFLSDRYTPCMRVEVDNGRFYLLKNQDSLLTDGRAGMVEIFEDVRFLGDTVEVLQHRRLFLAKIPSFEDSERSQKYFLDPGEQLRRLFHYPGDRNYVYVEKLGRESDYGWCYLSPQRENSSWRRYRRSLADERTIPPVISAQIERKIAEINGLLAQLFAHFNRSAAAAKTVPRWEIRVEKERITCTLTPADYRGEMEESTRYLMNGIANTLLGTPFGVFNAGGEIEVRRR